MFRDGVEAIAPEVLSHHRSYRGASLMRGTPLLGPYSRSDLGSYGGPIGGGLCLMSEVPLYI